MPSMRRDGQAQLSRRIQTAKLPTPPSQSAGAGHTTYAAAVCTVELTRYRSQQAEAGVPVTADTSIQKKDPRTPSYMQQKQCATKGLH